MKLTIDAYASRVLNGEQVACEWVKKACARYVDDRENCEERGLIFDVGRAGMAVAFFSLLRHWKGEWAGNPILLEPWQVFIIANLFGWYRADGTRRYRTAYVEVARKNGKSTLAAGIGLYLMLADGEPGAEVYTAATKRDQARIAHRDATEMIKRSPELKREAGLFKDNIYSIENASKFEPLGRDSDSLDGLNVHGVIADEVHAWKTGDMWDVLETATGARRQPLMLAITTAGYDQNSFCWTLHEYTEKVLDGAVEDDSFFGLIYTLDEEDDYEDESLWIKANPNLEVSKKVDNMRVLMKRAKEMPARLNVFLRKHLDIWTQAETRWINTEKWGECGKLQVASGELEGRPCYSGLDLSSTGDINALVHLFPPIEEKEPYKVLCRFFVPEESMEERSKRDRVPYESWVRGGYMMTTPGNVTDYDFILHQIREDGEVFDLQELAFDRWGSQKIVTDLQDIGFTADQKIHKQSGAPLLVQFGQGFASMSGPTKELERLILSVMLAHGDHPVLNWMAHNVVVREDPAGNLKPDKEKSSEKIDGIVALVMALGRASLHAEKVKSVYASRGIITI